MIWLIIYVIWLMGNLYFIMFDIDNWNMNENLILKKFINIYLYMNFKCSVFNVFT